MTTPIISTVEQFKNYLLDNSLATKDDVDSTMIYIAAYEYAACIINDDSIRTLTNAFVHGISKFDQKSVQEFMNGAMYDDENIEECSLELIQVIRRALRPS